MVYRPLFLSFLCFSLSFATLKADSSDGLDAAARANFYNNQTAVVARLDLAEINSATYNQTTRGLFDDTSWSFVSKDAGNIQKSAALYFTIAGALYTAGFKQVTVVGLEIANKIEWFGLVSLGPDVGDTAFSGIQGGFVIAASGSGVEMTRLGDYAVVHNKGLAIPDKKLYSSGVESVVALGLDQAKSTASIAWVALPIPSTVSQISSVFADKSGPSAFGTALASATYYGGYFILGSNPEIYIYARFPTEDQAANVLKLYNEKMDQNIKDGAAKDKEEEASKIKVLHYITLEEEYTRFKAALIAKTFGKVFILPWDTVSIRAATSAYIDRDMRPVKQENEGKSEETSPTPIKQGEPNKESSKESSSNQ